MKTFIAWAIANMMNIVYVSSVILFEIALLCFGLGSTEGIDIGAMAVFAPLLLAIALLFMGFQKRGTIADIIALIWNILIYLVLVLMAASFGAILIVVILMGAIGIALAIFNFRFTSNNIDEVIARRMKGWISNTDFFDITWKYAFNRLVETVVCFTYLAGFFLFISIIVA